MTRPCFCPEHLTGPAPRQAGEHIFTRQERESPDWPIRTEWRYRCSCGSAGQWQSQSESVAYHAWLRHTDRGRPR